MFEAAFRQHGAPKFVHADSGSAMCSTALADLFVTHGVTKTHNRPYVSNDNPFSESEFRTMKYRPNYPGIFHDLQTARDHLAGYVPWSNTTHRRSGIALFSPQQVHDGTWRHTHRIRGRAWSATTGNTPNDLAPGQPPQHQPTLSASTSPKKPSQSNSSDSTQLDIARMTPFGSTRKLGLKAAPKDSKK
jgi:hypothetical protein